jgi:hypothetical protein
VYSVTPWWIGVRQNHGDTEGAEKMESSVYSVTP